MVTVRFPSGLVLLLAALATPRLVSPQSTGDRIAVGVATLADLEQSFRTRPNPFDFGKLLFDPTVVRGWWDNGIHHDSIGSPRTRDSLETAILVAALHARAVTPEMMRECGGVPVKRNCPSAGVDPVVIAISDPRIVGDTAAILLRTGRSEFIGSPRPGGGALFGSIKLVRLVRRDGRWTVLCSVVAGSDAELLPSVVEARCTASMRGRAGGG